ncbi:MAG: Bax inhibitor-1/YccA family protein [Gemmiger sp.]|nr:Bax inhibitor-1/YccA family protein [Gemmiger sp.]
MDQKYYDIAYAESPYGTLDQYMSRTFGWMFMGLLVTFAVAIGTVSTGLYRMLYSTGLVFVLTIAELVLVVVLSARITKVQPNTATGMFFAYAVLNGINLSVYFVVYQLSTLILAFLVGALYFGIMALYGNRTSKDLSGWGPKLMAGLLTLLVVTLVGTLGSVFFGWSFGMLDLIVSAVGLLIFMGFTAYDTQKLKYYYSYYGGDAAMLQKSAIIGALQLYLDYINIFLYVLRILGRSRSND